MKYGMHSCGLKSYPIKEALKKAGEFGYDGFEIDIFPLANQRSSWEKYRDELRQRYSRIGQDRERGRNRNQLALPGRFVVCKYCRRGRKRKGARCPHHQGLY